MTDNTQPEAGSTHIIRYALEMGLLWIYGYGRDKVRKALDALDTLEAQLEAIGAGGVSGPPAAQAEGWAGYEVQPLYTHPSPPKGMAGWKHDCAALLMNDVELWIQSCPHCGKPRDTAPPTSAEGVEHG